MAGNPGAQTYPPAPLDAAARRLAWLPRPRWRLLISLLAALALLIGAVVVLNSPLLEIRTVTVRGTAHLTPEAVAQLSGLRGENLLVADLDAARQRLLALPLVKAVAISREWPNRVRVVVTERTPWARWEAEGQVYAIDDAGVVLDGLDAPAGGIVVRQVSSLPVVEGGAHVDLDAIALLQQIEQAGPPRGGPAIVGYEWSLRDGLTVVSRHGRIIFGDGEGFGYKYAVWEQLEQEAQRRGEPLLTADLRFGTRPAVEIGLGLGRATRITGLD